MKVYNLYKTVKTNFLANGIDESDARALFDYFYPDHSMWLSETNLAEAMPSVAKKITKIANRRIKTREPIYSIIGFSPFYNRFFKTNKHVLKPRLDTEILLSEALKYVTKNSQVLDLCTGSGILGITLNLETGATVTCADISGKALKICKQNAKLLNANISTIKSNMFNSVSGKFDVIVCNPPYIKTADIRYLDPEVKKFDPTLALDGGLDGLDFYRNLCNNFCAFLNKNGVLILEIGYNQGKILLELFKDFNVKLVKDFNNLDRVLIIKLKG